MLCKKIENLELVRGVNFEFIESLKKNGTKYLIIFDNSWKDICNSKAFVDIATAGRMLNIVVYLYRNSLLLKYEGVHLKVTEYQSLLAKRNYLSSYIDRFYKRCIVLDETTVHN